MPNETCPTPTDLTPKTIDRLLELGGNLTQPIETEAGVFGIVPNGCKVEELTRFYPPNRIKETVKLSDATSFIAYVNRFKTPATLLFAYAHEEPIGVCAVLDYHEAAPKLKPAYTAHRARFHFRTTDDWKTWMVADRKRMNQLDFAVWLEDNAPLLQNGLELLELVQSLHGHVDARFNQTIRLKDGAVKLVFDEDVVIRGTTQSSSKAGEMDLPPFITAKLAIFEGGPVQTITARLRERCENRKLTLWFETMQPARMMRECVDRTLAEIAEKTEITPLLGSIA